MALRDSTHDETHTIAHSCTQRERTKRNKYAMIRDEFTFLPFVIGNNGYFTPMLIASKNNQVEALQWLFDHGAKEDVRKPNNEGFTPFFLAAERNQVEALQWLFDHGAQKDTLRFILMVYVML